jgi:hypothetical protein
VRAYKAVCLRDGDYKRFFSIISFLNDCLLCWSNTGRRSETREEMSRSGGADSTMRHATTDSLTAEEATWAEKRWNGNLAAVIIKYEIYDRSTRFPKCYGPYLRRSSNSPIDWLIEWLLLHRN